MNICVTTVLTLFYLVSITYAEWMDLGETGCPASLGVNHVLQLARKNVDRYTLLILLTNFGSDLGYV